MCAHTNIKIKKCSIMNERMHSNPIKTRKKQSNESNQIKNQINEKKSYEGVKLGLDVALGERLLDGLGGRTTSHASRHDRGERELGEVHLFFCVLFFFFWVS